MCSLHITFCLILCSSLLYGSFLHKTPKWNMMLKLRNNGSWNKSKYLIIQSRVSCLKVSDFCIGTLGTTPAADRTLGTVVTSPHATFVWYSCAYFWTSCYVPFPITRNNYISYICDVLSSDVLSDLLGMFHYQVSQSQYCAIEVPIKMFFHHDFLMCLFSCVVITTFVFK